MFKTRFKTTVKTSNSLIEADGYSSIRITNTGDEAITINDNIKLATTKEWFWENDPGVFVDVPVYVSFAGGGANPKVLIEQYYFQEVKK